MLLLLLQTAWRNLWRNKRRSWLTIGAIAFALTLALFQRGVQIGTYELNISSVTNYLTGHLQIQHREYRETPTLRKSFVFTDSLQHMLRSIPAIRAAVPRIIAGGLISDRQHTFGVMIWGVDPALEQQATTLPEKVKSGRWIARPGEAIVGITLLKNLRLAIGDSAILLAPGYDGFLGDMYVRIVGTFQTGSQELDRTGIILHRSDADFLLNLHGRITHLLLLVDAFDDIDPVKHQLQQQLPDPLTVLRWDDIVPAMKQLIELDNISGILFLTILLVVVGFGILNTLLMAISERFREFGVLLAIGMPNSLLALMVFFETVWMIALGVCIGAIAGNLLVAYFAAYPVTFTGELAAIYREFGFLPQMTATMKWSLFLQTLTLLLGISIIAAVYPIIKTVRLEPLKGIRYT